MAALTDLINQVEDKALRERLMQEAARLAKQKKFGLVFEEHIPECTPLYGIEIKRGSTVAKKAGAINDMYRVTKINGGDAVCLRLASGESETVALSDLVPVAKFGESIYPTLQPIDKVENAPDSDPWHTLIEADNYHALQLLEYLYPKQVDCIYIDPPYNTGARDWKYNNDYVDSNDAWRHSKWLSMMKRRLKIAKRILNPDDSVLIVTIDEKEVHRLGILLEEIFPEARMQMVTIVIQAAGSNRKGELGRVEEYAYFLFFGKFMPYQSTDDLLNEAPSTGVDKVRWESLLRGGTGSNRQDSPNLFYPVFVDRVSGAIVGCGDSKPLTAKRSEWVVPDGTIAVWPLKTGGIEGRWRCTSVTLMELVNGGFAKAGKASEDGKGTIWYLGESARRKIQTDEFRVVGIDEQGAKIVEVTTPEKKTFPVKTVWNRSRHHAGWHGTNMVSTILPGKSFPFPKSLYAVVDTLRVATGNKPNALVVDFFAGSGTTLHAVNLLNAEDGGHRHCIMVTNNEVSADEAKSLTTQGFQPGDPEWEKLGIARYVTWPRTVCSIEGHDVNGTPLKGDYLTNDADGNPIPVSQGFKANAAYFKLGFLDKDDVALGRQFKEILPLLWLKAGAVGKRPELHGETPDMLILPENKFAILVSESSFMSFDEQLDVHPEIDTVFIVTDSEKAYREMISGISAKHTYQLYRSYLDNFRINARR